MKLQRAEAAHEKINAFADMVGRVLVDTFHYLASFAIGAAVAWSAVSEFIGMAARGHAGIHDILLLFIYLELGAMVGIYFKTSHMPVRFLIYVAITALTRLLIIDVQDNHSLDMGIVLVSGAILLLCLATLVIRFGSARYPTNRRQTRASRKPPPATEQPRES